MAEKDVDFRERVQHSLGKIEAKSESQDINISDIREDVKYIKNKIDDLINWRYKIAGSSMVIAATISLAMPVVLKLLFKI